MMKFIRYELPKFKLDRSQFLDNDPYHYKGSIDSCGNMLRLKQYLNVKRYHNLKLRNKLTPQKRKKHLRLRKKNSHLIRAEVKKMLFDIDRYDLRRKEHQERVSKAMKKTANFYIGKIEDEIFSRLAGLK
jgi:hypothetical protein